MRMSAWRRRTAPATARRSPPQEVIRAPSRTECRRARRRTRNAREYCRSDGGWLRWLRWCTRRRGWDRTITLDSQPNASHVAHCERAERRAIERRQSGPGDRCATKDGVLRGATQGAVTPPPTRVRSSMPSTTMDNERPTIAAVNVAVGRWHRPHGAASVVVNDSRLSPPRWLRTAVGVSRADLWRVQQKIAARCSRETVRRPGAAIGSSRRQRRCRARAEREPDPGRAPRAVAGRRGCCHSADIGRDAASSDAGTVRRAVPERRRRRGMQAFLREGPRAGLSERVEFHTGATDGQPTDGASFPTGPTRKARGMPTSSTSHLRTAPTSHRTNGRARHP